jgi:hypothetical protein
MGVLLLLISVFLYFIPAIVAASKNKRNSGAIFGLNLLLGWTIVGWVASLVWALTNDAEAPIVPTECGRGSAQTADTISIGTEEVS